MSEEPLSRARERIREGITGPKTVDEVRCALGPLMAGLFLSNRMRNAILEGQNGGEPLLSLQDLAVQAMDMFLVLEAEATDYYREIQN